MSTCLNLQISKIFGTSSDSSSQMATQDDLIAYTASGGVVISQINRETLQVDWQKFYCANSVLDQDYSGLIASGKLDEYEYPVYPETEVITRQGSSIRTKESIDTSNTGSSSANAIGSHHTIHDMTKPIRTAARRNFEDSSLTLANRVRSINCIAISPDKKLLAVGEVGYQPRIIIYSLAKDSMNIPVMIIQEHQFGINSLCFSPDSKKLCSLGLVNDGFLIVWKLINKKFVFHGSNKCSSVVNKMIWHDDMVITCGLRNIKIWKEDGPGNSPTKRSSLILKGRNVLLKKFLNSNFIDMVVINPEEVLVLTDQGDLSVINLDEDSMILKKIANLPANTNQILVDSIGESLIVAGKKVEIFSIDQLLQEYNVLLGNSDSTTTDNIKPTPSSPTKIVKRSGVLALKELFNGERFIYLKDNEQLITVSEKDMNDSKEVMNTLLKEIGGLKKCYNEDILVWSKSGLIKKLINKSELETLHSIVLPSEDVVLDNYVTSLDFNGQDLVIGDRYGTLYFLQKNSGLPSDEALIIRNSGYNEYQITRAHESSINCIIFFVYDNTMFCASASRDRTIQIFQKIEGDGETQHSTKWELFQTISVHKGNVLKILFSEGKLYSASSDRTLSVYKFTNDEESNQFKLYQEKVISTKNSPTTILVNESDLIISTTDKVLAIYDVNTLELKRVLKLYNIHRDSLLVDNMILNTSQNCLYVTSADKGVRCFDYSDGRMIATNWGHSDTILNLIPSGDNLISASADGCMFIWDIVKLDPMSHFSSAPSPALPNHSTTVADTDTESPSQERLSRSNSISLTNTPILKRTSMMGRVERKVLNTEAPRQLPSNRGASLARSNTTIHRTPTSATTEKLELKQNSNTTLSPRSPSTPRSVSKGLSTISPNSKSRISARLKSANSSPNPAITRSPLSTTNRNVSSSGISGIRGKLTQLTLSGPKDEEGDEENEGALKVGPKGGDFNANTKDLLNMLRKFQKSYVNEIDQNANFNYAELSKELKKTQALISGVDEDEVVLNFSNKVFDQITRKLELYHSVDKENQLN